MRILLIEDDQQLCEALKIQLVHAGYQVDCVYHGADAAFYALQPVYDLMILDRMLPGLDGLSLLRMIRENGIRTPVILATALDTVQERIAGLDGGADDYIGKPYDVEELLARIRALVRRPAVLEKQESLQYGDLEYQVQNHELAASGKIIQLSRREALLMEYFMQNPEKTLARALIFGRVWGPDGQVEDGNLDTYIYYLRKHLRTLKSEVKIFTVHGVGYKLGKTL